MCVLRKLKTKASLTRLALFVFVGVFFGQSVQAGNGFAVFSTEAPKSEVRRADYSGPVAELREKVARLENRVTSFPNYRKRFSMFKDDRSCLSKDDRIRAFVEFVNRTDVEPFSELLREAWALREPAFMLYQYDVLKRLGAVAELVEGRLLTRKQIGALREYFEGKNRKASEQLIAMMTFHGELCIEEEEWNQGVGLLRCIKEEVELLRKAEQLERKGARVRENIADPEDDKGAALVSLLDAAWEAHLNEKKAETEEGERESVTAPSKKKKGGKNARKRLAKQKREAYLRPYREDPELYTRELKGKLAKIGNAICGMSSLSGINDGILEYFDQDGEPIRDRPRDEEVRTRPVFLIAEASKCYQGAQEYLKQVECLDALIASIDSELVRGEDLQNIADVLTVLERSLPVEEDLDCGASMSAREGAIRRAANNQSVKIRAEKTPSFRQSLENAVQLVPLLQAMNERVAHMWISIGGKEQYFCSQCGEYCDCSGSDHEPTDLEREIVEIFEGVGALNGPIRAKWIDEVEEQSGLDVLVEACSLKMFKKEDNFERFRDGTANLRELVVIMKAILERETLSALFGQYNGKRHVYANRGNHLEHSYLWVYGGVIAAHKDDGAALVAVSHRVAEAIAQELIRGMDAIIASCDQPISALENVDIEFDVDEWGRTLGAGVRALLLKSKEASTFCDGLIRERNPTMVDWGVAIKEAKGGDRVQAIREKRLELITKFQALVDKIDELERVDAAYRSTNG